MNEVIIGTQEMHDGRALIKKPYHNTAEMRNLMDYLRHSEEQKTRTYTTYIKAGDTEFIVRTTSKEIHLRLGEIDENARQALMRLINAETKQLHDPEILLTYLQKNGNWRGYMCSVHRSSSNVLLIKMSPSN